MDSSYETPPQNQGISPMIWLIAAVVAICMCIGIVGVGGIGAYYFLAERTTSPTGVSAFVEATVIAVPPVEISEGETVVLEAGGETLTVEAMPDEGTNHVDEGDPVFHDTNPPTSGEHYGVWVEPGFYDEPVDDGYLVHNLEHGYVIIWYDCAHVDDCEALQDDIISVITAFDGYKVIGMPRDGMDSAITITSWTRIAHMEAFNFDLIEAYINQFQNQAPEPSAP